MRVETIGDATLYLGDCLEWFSEVPECLQLDALITDPPYGVGFSGKVTKHTDGRAGPAYADDDSTISEVVLPAVVAGIEICERAAVFPGTRNMQRYPAAKDIGGIVCPNGGGRSSWGFGCYHPVLFYGSSPHRGSLPTVKVIYHPGMHVTGEKTAHPCPKPLQFMEWAVGFASKHGDAVLDPFMGSGTTGVACANLGRKFIGIEIEEKYFDIACERIEAAYAQERLFV